MPMKHKREPFWIRPIDFVPALSGLIGKIALVTSFAVVWAQQLNITAPDFVFENVRLEIIIGSMVTLIAALLLPDTAPSGSLAPLIVLVPAMAGFGAHPFILSILTGILGILSIRTGIFNKLVSLSGPVNKADITLTFGISGIFMSLKNLKAFFGGINIPYLLMLSLLGLLYIGLVSLKRSWLMIPVTAVTALLFPLLFGMGPDVAADVSIPDLNPSYWWNTMWGIGFGLRLSTIIKTLPFAVFIVVLWAVDTVSIQAMIEANREAGEDKEEFRLSRSFIITSIRNILGGLFGGAQTSALWRSYLIPLFMVRRPMRASSVLLGILGVLAGVTAIPVKVLSFPPLIWFVLLFGIFLPFFLVGFKNTIKTGSLTSVGLVLCLTLAGLFISPIITWLGAVLSDKFIPVKCTTTKP